MRKLIDNNGNVKSAAAKLSLTPIRLGWTQISSVDEASRWAHTHSGEWLVAMPWADHWMVWRIEKDSLGCLDQEDFEEGVFFYPALALAEIGEQRHQMLCQLNNENFIDVAHSALEEIRGSVELDACTIKYGVNRRLDKVLLDFRVKQISRRLNRLPADWGVVIPTIF